MRIAGQIEGGRFEHRVDRYRLLGAAIVFFASLGMRVQRDNKHCTKAALTVLKNKLLIQAKDPNDPLTVLAAYRCSSTWRRPFGEGPLVETTFVDGDILR